MNIPRIGTIIGGFVLGVILGLLSRSPIIFFACVALGLGAQFGSTIWSWRKILAVAVLVFALAVLTAVVINSPGETDAQENASEDSGQGALSGTQTAVSRSATADEGIGGLGVSDAELLSEPGAQFVEFMITPDDGETVADACKRGTYDFEFMLETMFNYEFKPAESMQHEGGTVYCKYENLAFVVPDLGDGGDDPALPEGFNEEPAFPIAVTIEGVPGGLQQSSVNQALLMGGPPEEWLPDNLAPANMWTHPFVMAGFAPDSDPATVYTNHVSFNQESDSVYEVTFYYGMWLYENGDLGDTIVHSTYHQLLWLWGAEDGQPGHDGIAWWGPVPVDGEESLSWVDVTYRDRDGNVVSTCTGHSFEVVPNTLLELSFVNQGKTSAVWGQGPWGLSSGFGIIEPDCSP